MKPEALRKLTFVLDELRLVPQKSAILSREDYIDNTVNCRFTVPSYKDKRKMKRDPSEHIRFEHTHEPIIDMQIWETVQKLRQGKRRPTSIGETSKYSGLLFCADCGSKLYFNHKRTDDPKSYSFFYLLNIKEKYSKIILIYLILKERLKMRRKDREVTDVGKIKKILQEAKVLRIALNNGTYPYILPVNYGFIMDGTQLTLFFHGSKEGTKHKIIANDNHITFEVDCGHKIMQPIGEESCTGSFAYESVIGNGIIEKAKNTEKEQLLTLLLLHYGIKKQKFNPIHLENTVVYKITATNYTAKRKINDRV